MRMSCLLLAALLIMVAGFPALGAAEAGPRFVTPGWLSANLENPDLRIIDLRGDVRDYWEAHIPGAVYLDAESLRWPDGGVPGKLMAPEALARLLGALGIGKESKIIIYSEVNHYRAAYFVWALDYLKHKSWAILENGFLGWKRQALPTTQDYPRIKSVRYDFKGDVDSGDRATMEEIRDRDRSKSVLLDVRPNELYTGEKGAWKRRGHIPGAISHFWVQDLNNDGSWKNKEVLIKAYADLGVVPAKVIFVSCGQGQMSAHAYLTLKYVLGFTRVRNYDGSFNEWSNLDALPVEIK
jgi:thiosulfate/3-mercaptopyruvate sulfurtransferase